MKIVKKIKQDEKRIVFGGFAMILFIFYLFTEITIMMIFEIVLNY